MRQGRVEALKFVGLHASQLKQELDAFSATHKRHLALKQSRKLTETLSLTVYVTQAGERVEVIRQAAEAIEQVEATLAKTNSKEK